MYEIRLVLKAFQKYGIRGFLYLYWRYIVAPRILRITYSLEAPETHPELSVHILFGHRDVLIAMWALASYYAVSHTIGSLMVHDDGTLTESDRARVKKLFPNARIVSQSDLRSTAESVFAIHPRVLDFFTTKQWQSRKLLDPYLASTRNTILVIDSDVLWYRDPPFLKESGVWMMSNEPWYCRMPFLDGTTLDDARALCNSGIVYFPKDAFDLTRLDEYLVKTGAHAHHFLEQAGYAYALQNPKLLPVTEYPIKGVTEDNAVLRHYTGPSRAKFFFRGIPYLLTHTLAHVRD